MWRLWEKASKTKCVDCNQNYCEACAQFIHLVNKKFINHKMQNVESKQMVTKEEFNCFCFNKKNIQDFCLQCETGICKLCFIINHKGHKQISIEELMSQKIKWNSHASRLIYSTFVKFAQATKRNYGLRNKIKGNDFFWLTDFVNEVHALVNKHLEKINEEFQRIELQMSWINETIDWLFGIWAWGDEKFSSKRFFQILQYFSHSMYKKEIVMQGPKINNNKFVEKLEEINKLAIW